MATDVSYVHAVSTYYLVGGVKGKLTQPRPKPLVQLEDGLSDIAHASQVRNQKDKPA